MAEIVTHSARVAVCVIGETSCIKRAHLSRCLPHGIGVGVKPFTLLFGGDAVGAGLMSLSEQYRAAMLRRNLAHGTVATRTNESRRWLRYAGDQWTHADRRLVEEWLDTRPLGARARYTAISHLSAFYRWAIREEFATIDPTTAVERPRLPLRLPRPITAAESEQVVDGADELRPVVLLMLDAGLRCCEVAALRWSDVDLEAGTVYVFGKGSRERLMGMPQRLRLELYLAHAEAGTSWVTGRQMTPAAVSRSVADRCRELALDGVTAHRLRHTYATRLYRATGGDLRTVQMALGHASVANTQIYAAIDADRVLAAARTLDDF